MIKEISNGIGTRTRLSTVPKRMVHAATSLARKENLYKQLWGSLVVDCELAKKALDWAPPVSQQEGLRRALYKTEGLS